MKVRFVVLALLATLGFGASSSAASETTLSLRLLVKAKKHRLEPGVAREQEVPPLWRRLAECETGGDWKHRNSTYQGGLGFYHGSWDAYRPRGFPREAYLATPLEQVEVGRRILADVGWSAWPACSLRLGLR